MKGLGSVLLVVGLVAGVGGSGAAASGRAESGSDGPFGANRGERAVESGPAGARVTLVTGDRVTLGAGGEVRTVDPGRGRSEMTFLVRTVDEHVVVVPRDAVPAIADGRLDERLFDVTQLVAFGYDDAGTDTVPLLVTDRTAGTPEVLSGSDSGVAVDRDLPSIGGSAVELDKVAAGEFWSSVVPAGSDGGPSTLSGGIERIWLDGKVEASLDESVPQIGAPTAWEAGYDGDGVTVAVLDTGVDGDHPDLAGKVAASANFTDSPDPDVAGHGTHVAGTIAGTGVASDGRYTGVAPGARLVAGKVLDDDGDGTESQVIAGMEWAATDQGADVVNMSLGGPDTEEVDPLELAVETLTAQTGALFVVAAGNEGAPGTIGSPASADAALAVGAVDKSDELAWFSSQGPRVGDGGLKPDLTAPGQDITSAASTHAGFGSDYIPADGTSMATPHVSGSAAILAQLRTDWSAGELKAALMGSADPHPGLTAYEQGAGRVDIPAALEQTVLAQPAGISFGRAPWPHDDDNPIEQTLTYRNTGTDDIELDLTTELTGPDGQPAPDGALVLDTDRITVPASGTADVSLTAVTSHHGPDGHYTGQVTASQVDAGDAPVITTPLAVDKEIEAYTVTVTHTDRNGEAPGFYYDYLLPLDPPDPLTKRIVRVGSGSVYTMRVPPGRYLLNSWVDTYDGDDYAGTATLVDPGLVIDADTTLTLDARTAEPTRVEIPDEDIPVHFAALHYDVSIEQGVYGFLLFGTTFDELFSAQLGPPASGVELFGNLTGLWADVPEAEDDPEQVPVVESPDVYSIVLPTPGAVPVGVDRTIAEHELATIVSRYGAQEHGTVGMAARLGWHVDSGSATAAGVPLELPGKLRWHLNSEPGVKWGSEFEEDVPTDGFYGPAISQSGDEQRFEPGRRYTERWNRAPFSPSIPAPHDGLPSAGRDGDLLSVESSPFVDASGVHGWPGDLTEVETQLYSDGELIASDPSTRIEAELPPDEAEYRVSTSTARAGVTPFTLRQEAAWTFSSAHTEEVRPLPLWAVRFAPAVNGVNSVGRDPVHVLPIHVEPQPGAEVGRIRELEVEFSVDGGQTWTDAPVIRAPGSSKALAIIASGRPEHGNDFISLRTTAADTHTNTVEQTITNAYRVG